MRSPCFPSLTLGCVCFWPAVSQAFVGCIGGLGCPSGFVNAYSGSWLILVPAVFLHLPWVLPSRFQVGCWLEVVAVYPWLSSLHSFAAEGVAIVLCQVLVGLPSWCCSASGLLGLLVFLLLLLGHLSQVQSVLFLCPRL